ncbi:glutathione S-transferase N-terminal domain-containing protein [Stakelama sp. CBK3Z-3]|uniref:Glutathione S-transferase N-terminal domain-containing protein n=1 Tax=Stakelama flava TaxID=2860338 RepID=A0ABS6XM84_9SPHN|nr:glutathione S-transferase N-terminal domain-containing protein [Stakelama flava]MBW4330496.1 glutathione S-transferase N-terminal domain-containing protein [Stakelama flava]
MKLYDAEWAPSPRRVRIFLAEKGVDVPRETIDLRKGEQSADPYLKINPRGAVPALELDSGEVLTESAAICRYIEALHPEPCMFGATPLDIGRIESWTRRVESDGYAAAVYVFRNCQPRLAGRGEPGHWPTIPQIPELATRGGIMWRAFTEALDNRLTQSEWLAGDSYSFADITALITIDFARAARLEVGDGQAGIQRWYTAASARPSASA